MYCVGVINASALPSAGKVELGDSLTVSFSAVYGEGDYNYDFLVKKSDQTKWTTKMSRKAVSTFSFSVEETGLYDVCVKAYDANNTVVKKYF